MNIWKTLLEIAVHAPSPHNVQPWRVRIINDCEADLFVDIQRTLPKEDVTGSFIILAMGMFIEALRIVAANRNFKLCYKLHHEPAWYAASIIEGINGTRVNTTLLPFARLRLTPDTETGAISPRYSDALFLARRTSRLALENETVPEASAHALIKLAAEHDQQYAQIVDPATIFSVLERNIGAVFEDLNAPDYHDEIVSWFRFTNRAALRTRDGLDYRCMNTSRAAFWLGARFPKLLQMRLARPLLWKLYRAQLGNAPAIGFLAGKFWNPEDAIGTGHFLMRFWLELAVLGLYIHPLGNLVTNPSAAAWCLETTGIQDIWLVFKIGRSKEPPKSYRRAVEEVLVA